MASLPQSCPRCKEPLLADSASGLCEVCSGTHAGESTIVRVFSGVVSRVLNVFRLLRKRFGRGEPKPAPHTDEARPTAPQTGLGRNPVHTVGTETRTALPQTADTQSERFHYSDLPIPGGFYRETTLVPAPVDDDSTADAPSRPEPPRPPHPPGYELLGEISSGGMGVVYLARELATCEAGRPESGDRVAIKYLRDPNDAAQLARFEIEAKASRLKHKNTIKLVTSNLRADPPYFVMEVAGGGSLAKRVSANAPMDPVLAAGWMKAVTEAVAEAHAKNIIHRDIKPGNILLARNNGDDAAFVRLKSDPKDAGPFSFADYYPKLSDFGLAKRLGSDDGVTVGSAGMGTPPYMSPEQARNPQGGDPEDRLNHRADVYSLGATLYHLLCGRPPYRGTPAEVVVAVLDMKKEPPRLRSLCPEIPLELEAVVVKAMAKDPRHRYQTAEELATALGRFMAGKKTGAPKQTRLRRAWRAVCRQKRAVAAVAVVACVFVVGVLIAAPPNGGKEQAKVEPPDPLEVMKDQLKSDPDIPIDLMDESGIPKWSKWRLGRNGESHWVANAGKTFGFESVGYRALDIFPDVPLDRFRVTVQFQQNLDRGAAEPVKPSESTAAFVGVYLASDTIAAPADVVFHPCVGVMLNDFDRTAAIGKPQKERFALLRDTLICVKDGKVIAAQKEPLAEVAFIASPTQPGPVRTIRLDVTPTSITAFWVYPDGRVTEFRSLRPFTPAGWKLNQQTRLNERHPSVGLICPPWSPRVTLGVWCHRAGIEVHRITLTPLTAH